MKSILPRFRRKKVEKQVDQVSNKPEGSLVKNDDRPAYSPEPAQFAYATACTRGKLRDHNEDSTLIITSTLGGDSDASPLGLFIVADGMGGHQNGELASAAAVRSLGKYLLKSFSNYLDAGGAPNQEPIQELMQAAILETGMVIPRLAPGGGTTLTAAMVFGGQMTIGHIGDSRAMCLRPGGKVELLTRDHSLVRRLEELGQISADEAAIHPQRNVLYRALGQGETLEPDIFTIPFPKPGFLLICSDGLWGVVKPEKIHALVYSASDLQAACQELVNAANQAGGPDNISVILVQLLEK
jgi:serine/threonine protein phosphatase PrpC